MTGRRPLGTKFSRFLLGGVVNSGITYVVYLLLAEPAGDIIAFTIAYVLGIVLSYFINALFVFRARPSFGSAIRFPGIYLIQYLLGLALVWLFVGSLEMPRAIAMVLIIAINAIVAFLLLSVVFAQKSPLIDQNDNSTNDGY